MYIQKNEDFIGIQELTFDEVGLVVGGDGKKKEAPKKEAPKINDDKRSPGRIDGKEAFFITLGVIGLVASGAGLVIAAGAAATAAGAAGLAIAGAGTGIGAAGTGIGIINALEN